MRRFFKWWVGQWRSIPVEVASPMPVEAASYALASTVTGHGSALVSGLGLGLGPRIVIGKIEGDYVRLQALRPGMRNSWRPVLTGRLYPAPHGSQLVGELGMSSFVKAFSAVWLAIPAMTFAGGLLGMVVQLLRGDPSKALPALGMAGGGLGFVAFFIGLSAVGSKMGVNDAAFLQQWVAEHLHAHDVPGTRTMP